MAKSVGRFWLPMGDRLQGRLRRGEQQGACGEPGTRPGLSCTWGAAGAPELSSLKLGAVPLCAVRSVYGGRAPNGHRSPAQPGPVLDHQRPPLTGCLAPAEGEEGPQPAHSSLGTGIPTTLAQASASESQGDTALGPGTSQGWWSLPSALPGAVPALRHLRGQNELGSQRPPESRKTETDSEY